MMIDLDQLQEFEAWRDARLAADEGVLDVTAAAFALEKERDRCVEAVQRILQTSSIALDCLERNRPVEDVDALLELVRKAILQIRSAAIGDGDTEEVRSISGQIEVRSVA